jgi:hypothetical protein
MAAPTSQNRPDVFGKRPGLELPVARSWESGLRGLEHQSVRGRSVMIVRTASPGQFRLPPASLRVLFFTLSLRTHRNFRGGREVFASSDVWFRSAAREEKGHLMFKFLLGMGGL